MEELKQGHFEGWAIVEMMGHRKEIGYVTTEAYGPAVLFRVDTPGLEEREYVLAAPAYAHETDDARRWCPTGTKVKRPASPPRSCLVAPASLYAMNPCTEEAARRAIEVAMPRPLILLELPPQSVGLITDGLRSQDQGALYEDEGDEDEEEDDDDLPQ